MFYYVESWDSIELIAFKLGVSLSQLFQYNPSIYYQPIYIGQKLYIPLHDSKIITSQNSDDTKKGNSGKTNDNYTYLINYTIQIGDTLEDIADKFHTTKEAIMQYNGLGSEALEAGDILLIRISREYMDELFEYIPENGNKNLNPKSKYIFSHLHDLFLNKDLEIWKEMGYKNALFFVSKMAITAAGAPNAFHKDNDLALDFLANAGNNGNWWSLVTEEEGYPMIQTEYDPYPGYYISKTALSDCKKPKDDPTRYVDAREIPYIALPTHHMMGAELGDSCVVINTLNGKIAYAIIADVGPDDSLGIGSIALANDLDIASNAKYGGIEDGILYIIFSQSGKKGTKVCYDECYENCNENCDEKCDNECYEKMEKLWCNLKTREQIINESQQLFNQWGGIKKVNALFGQFPLSYTNINE